MIKKFQIPLFIIITFGLAQIVLFFYEEELITFNRPISLLILLILILIGIITRNELYYGIGLSGLLPNYLLGVNDILNEEYNLFILNFTFLLLGLYLFLKKNIKNWWSVFIGGIIFEYYLFLPRINLSQSIDEILQGLFPSGFYIVVFISGFFMILFTHMKQIYENKINNIPVEHRVLPKTRIENYFDDKIKYPYRKLSVLILVLIGIIGLTIIRSIIEGKLSLPYTISTWSFVIGIIVIFVNINSSVLSSEVIAISPPIIYLMVYDIEWQNGTSWIIFNFIFHLMIIIAAVYVFAKKRNARWDYIFAWGYFLKTLCYVLNIYIPNYVVNVIFFMYMVFFETMITSIIYFELSLKDLNKIRLKLKSGEI
jgi:hypothetical protein